MKSSSLFQFPFFSLRNARTNSSKKLSYYLILFFVISLSFASCSDKNKVKVSNTNFKDEVEIIQNLVFTFNKDIVPDSMCNNWGSSDYIVFEPNIPGRFKWSNTHELMFSPSQQLAPCTNYKATIQETILSK